MSASGNGGASALLRGTDRPAHRCTTRPIPAHAIARTGVITANRRVGQALPPTHSWSSGRVLAHRWPRPAQLPIRRRSTLGHRHGWPDLVRDGPRVRATTARRGVDAGIEQPATDHPRDAPGSVMNSSTFVRPPCALRRLLLHSVAPRREQGWPGSCGRDVRSGGY